MKEEKNLKQETPVENPTIPANPFKTAVTPIQPKVATPSMDDAIRSAIKSGKSFKLVRKVYQGKNKKFYYSYSVIVMLKNALRCKEIRVSPYVGYVRSDDAIKASQSNGSGYTMLNFMYDFGSGCSLICREDETVDRNGIPHTSFNFYAVSTDDTGIQQEYPMNPNTVGDKSLLLSAFTGFGGVRDWEESDLKTCEPLVNLFDGYCAPGYAPEVDIENQ